MYRSRFLPRFLGVWLSINGIAYVILSFTGQLLPQYQDKMFTISQPALSAEGIITRDHGRQAASPGRSLIIGWWLRATSHFQAQRKWFPAGAAKPSGYFFANLFLSELSEASIAAITTATQDAPRRFGVLIVNFCGAFE